MKKDLLELFKKYGFNSSLKEPFLYEDNKNIGIFYSFKDPYFGTLNRVYIPNNIEEAEIFLKNYYSYINAHCLKIKLESYNNPFAKPYFEEDIELLDENLESNQLIYSPLYQSANLIIKVIAEKMNLSLTTYENVKKLNEKYASIKKEWCKKKNIPYTEPQLNNLKNIDTIKNEQNIIINKLNKTLNTCTNFKELKTTILQLIKYLENLEKDHSLINNKYFLLKIPLEIDMMQKEILILNQYNISKLNKKNKKELESKLKELKEHNQKNKIISLANFTNIEQNKIKEKYTIINDLELESIGNYLIEFDSLPIKNEPIIKEQEGFNILNQYFNDLPEEEKNILYLIIFFKKLLDNNINYNYLLKDYFKIILSPNNVLAKIKIFKKINMTSIKDFEASIKELTEKLQKIKPIEMPCDIQIYFEENKIINDKLIIASSKKSCMPKTETENPIIYIATLKKNSLVNFIPSKLIIDIANDDKISLKEGNQLFLIDFKENNIYEEKSDIIKVAKVRILEKTTTDIVTISKLKTDKIICYKKINIERKNK